MEWELPRKYCTLKINHFIYTLQRVQKYLQSITISDESQYLFYLFIYFFFFFKRM